MTVHSINSGASIVTDMEYFDKEGVLIIEDATVGRASAEAFAVAGTTGVDRGVATEAYNDSSSYAGFQGKALELYVDHRVKSDTTTTQNGYRITNLVDGTSRQHDGGAVYCDVMFVKTDSGEVLWLGNFSAPNDAEFYVVRCIFNHQAGKASIKLNQSSNRLVFRLKRNIFYRPGFPDTSCIEMSLEAGSEGVQPSVEIDNNIGINGSSLVYFQFKGASITDLPLLRNNVGLTMNNDTFKSAYGWHVSSSNNYADGDSTNPGTGGGDISTPTDFVTLTTNLACKDETAAALFAGIDLNESHNFDFNNIMPGFWTVGATDFESAGGNGGASPNEVMQSVGSSVISSV